MAYPEPVVRLAGAVRNMIPMMGGAAAGSR